MCLCVGVGPGFSSDQSRPESRLRPGHGDPLGQTSIWTPPAGDSVSLCSLCSRRDAERDVAACRRRCEWTDGWNKLSLCVSVIQFGSLQSHERRSDSGHAVQRVQSPGSTPWQLLHVRTPSATLLRHPPTPLAIRKSSCISSLKTSLSCNGHFAH